MYVQYLRGNYKGSTEKTTDFRISTKQIKVVSITLDKKLKMSGVKKSKNDLLKLEKENTELQNELSSIERQIHLLENELILLKSKDKDD